jgi:hypothetical protein
MKRTVNDWEPEVRSLLKTLETHGLEIVSCNNGEQDEDFPCLTIDGKMVKHLAGKFLDEITACDECALYVKNRDGKKLWVSLVFGNRFRTILATLN